MGPKLVQFTQITWTVGRCDKTGRSLIYSATIYFPCVTPTKRSVVWKCCGMLFIPPTVHILLGELFSTHFQFISAKYFRNTILDCFRLLEFFMCNPKFNFSFFRKKIHFSVDSSKALSFVGKLHIFCYIKVEFLDFFASIKMLWKKNSYSN